MRAFLLPSGNVIFRVAGMFFFYTLIFDVTNGYAALLFSAQLDTTPHVFTSSTEDDPATVEFHVHSEPRRYEIIITDSSGTELSKTTCTSVLGLLPVNGTKASLRFITSKTQSVPESLSLCFNNQTEVSKTCTALNNRLYPELKTDTFDQPLQERKIGVVFNPASGTGEGKVIYEWVQKIIGGQGGEVHWCETSRDGEEVKAFLEREKGKLEALLIIGGDGTVNQVFTALAESHQPGDPLLHNLAIIPAGSGNGLAATMETTTAPLAFKSFLSALLTPSAAGRRVHAKQYTVTWSDQTVHTGYLLLSFTTAVVADVDIGSEWMRWLGDCRFTISGIRFLLVPRNYHLQIITDTSTYPEEEYAFLTAMNVTHAGIGYQLASEVKAEDENLELTTITSRELTSCGTFCRRCSTLINMDKGGHLDTPYTVTEQVRSLTIHSLEHTNRFVVDGELLTPPQSTEHIIRYSADIYPEKIEINPSAYSMTLLVN
ncbi:diacylglycerol/lipid kinase family protein [Spongorhabdus nitratireducens]